MRYLQDMKNNKLRFLIKQLRDLLLALLLTLLISFMYLGTDFFSNLFKYTNGIAFGVLIGFSLWKVNQFIGWYVSKVNSWRNSPKKTLILSLSFSAFFSIVDIYLVYYFGFRWLFGSNLNEHLSIYIPQMFMILAISLAITISYYLAYFFKWWRISVLEQEKLKQEAIELRYNALKSQVNPHFLFNSLSVLSALVDSDTEKAKEFIQQFSEIFRYVLDQNEKELVPLADELRFAKSYINLHQIRHGQNLKVNFEIDDLSGFVIPLSLQILLENCFKHNVISDEKPLTVKIWRVSNSIYVQNNLQKRITSQNSEGIGIKTISKRYEFLSHRPIEIVQDENYFTAIVPIVKSVL